MKFKKLILIFLLLICLISSTNYSYSYFCSSKLIKNKFNTVKYNYVVDLDGGKLSSSPYTKSGNLVLPNPTKDDYEFVEWEVNNNTYKAVYSKTTYSVNINTKFQDCVFKDGYEKLTYDVFLDGVLVADDTIKYSNSSVKKGSTLRVVANPSPGLTITENSDSTFIINDDLDLIVAWRDTIAPIIKDINIQVVDGSCNSYVSFCSYLVTIEAYDEGTGIKTYSQYQKNDIGSSKHPLKKYEYPRVSSTISNTWCGVVTDYSNNKTELCKTYSNT